MPSLFRSSAIMGAGTLASRLLGLLRTTLTVGVTGLTGLTADAWQVSNTLPNIFQLLLAGGVINAVIVPQIVAAMKRHDGGQDYINRLLTLAISLMAITAVTLTVAAPLVVSFFVSPSWSDQARRLAVVFAFLCLPQMFFYGLYTLLGQVLNAREKFGAYMWAPALANLIAIAGLGWFYLTGQPLRAPVEQWTPVMIAVLAGSASASIVAQAAVLLIPLRQIGFRFRFTWGFRGYGLRAASAMAAWAFAAVLVSQVAGYVVTTQVLTTATHQLKQTGVAGAGLTVYSNAFLIFMLPHGIITVSLVTALFTRMSQAVVEQRHSAVILDLHHAMRVCAVALLPITAAVVLLGPVVARTVFFTSPASSADLMTPTLVAMFIGLLPFGWFYLVQRVFYAYSDGRTPFILQVLLTAVAAGVTLLFATRSAEHAAMWVGIGQALSNLAAALAGLFIIHRRWGAAGTAHLIRQHVRVLTATLVATVVVGAAWRLAHPLWEISWWSQALGGLVTASALLIGALWLMLVMRVREAADLLAPLLRRLTSLAPPNAGPPPAA